MAATDLPPPEHERIERLEKAVRTIAESLFSVDLQNEVDEILSEGNTPAEPE